jgi:hypothetical protein
MVVAGCASYNQKFLGQMLPENASHCDELAATLGVAPTTTDNRDRPRRVARSFPIPKQA